MKRLCLVGAGPIGIEMAQTMARFGSQVTIFEIAPQLLPREDPDASEVLRTVLEEEMRIEYAVRINNIEYVGPPGGAAPETLAATGGNVRSFFDSTEQPIQIQQKAFNSSIYLPIYVDGWPYLRCPVDGWMDGLRCFYSFWAVSQCD